MPIAKIVSGGQTGVDRGAIEAAYLRGFPYGGYVPRYRLAEDARVPDKYTCMIEDTCKDYGHRTEANVVHSDATLILSRTEALTRGTKKTVTFCERYKRPCLVLNPDEADVAAVHEWLENTFGPKKAIVLNVAGPRESKSPGGP